MIEAKLRSAAQVWLNQTLSGIQGGQPREYRADQQLVADLHLDSLEMTELIDELEHYIGLRIQEKVWSLWRQVGDIEDFLNKNMPSPFE